MLLHGIGSSAEIWWSVISKLLCQGYEIVAPDMLGHGYSSTPKYSSPYKFKNLFKYALKIFDYYAATSSNQNVIIIGHSFGYVSIYHK